MIELLPNLISIGETIGLAFNFPIASSWGDMDAGEDCILGKFWGIITPKAYFGLVLEGNK